MAGTDLFTHIRYLAWTTVPTIVITLIIFLVIGLNRSQPEGLEDIAPVLNAIDQAFNITPWLFLVPVIVITMIIRKVPALPAPAHGHPSGRCVCPNFPATNH